MKKSKVSKKELSDICLKILENALPELDNPAILMNSSTKFVASFKMYTDLLESAYDFTPLVNVVRFNGIDYLAKTLRTIHNNYAIMNTREMITDLNSKKLSCSLYSESIPDELRFLKELADTFGEIKPIN